MEENLGGPITSLVILDDSGFPRGCSISTIASGSAPGKTMAARQFDRARSAVIESRSGAGPASGRPWRRGTQGGGDGRRADRGDPGRRGRVSVAPGVASKRAGRPAAGPGGAGLHAHGEPGGTEELDLWASYAAMYQRPEPRRREDGPDRILRQGRKAVLDPGRQDGPGPPANERPGGARRRRGDDGAASGWRPTRFAGRTGREDPLRRLREGDAAARRGHGLRLRERSQLDHFTPGGR